MERRSHRYRNTALGQWDKEQRRQGRKSWREGTGQERKEMFMFCLRPQKEKIV